MGCRCAERKTSRHGEAQWEERLHQGLLGAAPAAGGLGLGDATPFALGDEVTARLDLAEDAVTLDGLAEPGDEMLGGLAVSQIYCCHKRSVLCSLESTFGPRLLDLRGRHGRAVLAVPLSIARPEAADGIPFLLLRGLEHLELVA